MRVAGELAHVGSNFGDDVLDRVEVNARHRVQLLLQLLVNKRDHEFLDSAH